MLLKQLNSIQHTEVWNWTKKTHKMTEMADAIYAHDSQLCLEEREWSKRLNAEAITFCQLFDLAIVGATGMVKVG